MIHARTVSYCVKQGGRSKSALVVTINEPLSENNYSSCRTKLAHLLKEYDTCLFKFLNPRIITAHTIKLLHACSKSSKSRVGLIVDEKFDSIMVFMKFNDVFIFGKNEQDILMKMEGRKNS